MSSSFVFGRCAFATGGSGKVLCATLMVFIGPTQFFFGYIETYAPLPFFLVAFLLSGITALRKDKPPLWATVFFGAGAFMHILLAFLSPALLGLWGFFLFRRFSIFRNPQGFGLCDCGGWGFRMSPWPSLCLLSFTSIPHVRIHLRHTQLVAPVGMDQRPSSERPHGLAPAVIVDSLE